MRNAFAACPIATISNAVNQNANTSGPAVASLKSEPCQASGKIRGIREIYIFYRKLTSWQRRRRFAVPAINRAVRQLWRQFKKNPPSVFGDKQQQSSLQQLQAGERERALPVTRGRRHWGQRIVHLHLLNGFLHDLVKNIQLTKCLTDWLTVSLCDWQLPPAPRTQHDTAERRLQCVATLRLVASLPTSVCHLKCSWKTAKTIFAFE